MSARPHQFRDDVVYHAFRIFLAVGGRLPLTLTRPVASSLGILAMALNPRDRRRSRDNFRIAFPDLDETGIGQLMRANAKHLGTLAAEAAWLGQASPSDVLDSCTATGIDHLWRAIDTGPGAVLITGHCGNWELLNAWLGASGIPMTIAVRDIYDPRLGAMATELRERFGPQVVPRGSKAGRQLVSALVHQRVIGLLIDQDIRDIPGVFVPFFGRLAWTPSGAASLALHKSNPVVPAFCHRRSDGRFGIEIHPPLTLPTSGSKEDQITELTAAATAAIEQQIRRHPAQWVWMHRRWRTQPPYPPGE